MRARPVHDVQARLSRFETDRGAVRVQRGDAPSRARLERDVAAVGETQVRLLGRRRHEEIVVVRDLYRIDFESERGTHADANADEHRPRDRRRRKCAERPARDPFPRRLFGKALAKTPARPRRLLWRYIARELGARQAAEPRERRLEIGCIEPPMLHGSCP